MTQENPHGIDITTCNNIKSSISDMFDRIYPRFSGHKNFPGISDTADKDLIDRLSIIASETKSNGIGIHKDPSDYTVLEKACHLDNIESITGIKLWPNIKTEIRKQRLDTNNKLGIEPQNSWEKISRIILQELGENEPEFHFDETQGQVTEVLKKAA